MVTARHSIISIQLISGMYIWPCTVEDVCTIFTPGKQLNEEHCLIIEKVPVIIAWLPTTAASIAITRTGHLSDSTKTVASVNDAKYAGFLKWNIVITNFFTDNILKGEKGNEEITWYWHIKSNLITTLKVVMLWNKSSLSHISQYKSRINHRYECNLLEKGINVKLKTVCSYKSGN